jgi:phenylacetic acid degradation operon negative regulatory protein
MPAASRTIIMGIFVTAGRGLTASQLIALAAPLGVSATNVKSHLTRMVGEGVLRRHGRARLATYEATRDQARFVESIRDRLIENVQGPWDSTWLQLTLPVLQIRSQRERLHSGLWFEGFRTVAPNVYVRPAWPSPWAEDVARRYADAVAGTCLRGVVLVSPGDLSGLYDLNALDSEAVALASRIRRKARVNLGPKQAFVERIRIGGEVVQLVAHDPKLPDEIWGNRHGVRNLVKAFSDFEAVVAKPAAAFVEHVVRGSLGKEQS